MAFSYFPNGFGSLAGAADLVGNTFRRDVVRSLGLGGRSAAPSLASVLSARPRSCGRRAAQLERRSRGATRGPFHGLSERVLSAALQIPNRFPDLPDKGKVRPVAPPEGEGGRCEQVRPPLRADQVQVFKDRHRKLD